MDELGEILILRDAIDVDILKIAGANRADVLVATTGQDEENLVICQMVKIMFINPKTIALVNDPQNEDVFAGLGIDSTVSSTRIIDMLIEQKMDTSMITPLLALKGGKVEIIQAELTKNSPLAGKQLIDVTLPSECIIISVIRQGQEDVVIPVVIQCLMLVIQLLRLYLKII